MKKTIKEDLEEKYKKIVLINDNNLLIYTNNEIDPNKIDIRLRYIENNTIIEVLITSILEKDLKELLKINDKAIAVLKRREEQLVLDRLYVIDKHEFSLEDFIDIEYESAFSKKRGNEYVKR